MGLIGGIELSLLTLTKEDTVMSRKNVTIIYSVVFIVSLLLVSQVSWAQATRTAVSGIMITTGVGGPDKEWIVGNNMHLRGISEMGVVTGDLEGTFDVLGNYHLNLLTGEGQSSGKGTFILTGNGLTGTFEGTYVGKLIDFGDSLTTFLVAHGISGEVEGMKFFGTATFSWPGPYQYEGYILDPHGE
jgi:hypothetical protein